MKLELTLKRRLAISAALGLVIARVAPADPAVTTREALALDGSRTLIAAPRKVARARHTTGAIAVVDDGGDRDVGAGAPP